MQYRNVIVGTFLLFLTACATQPISLKKDVANKIDEIEHVVLIPQNNLDVSVIATNPGNTGFIGALIAGLIDSSRQSSAKEEAAPIIDELEDFDFRKVMLDAFSEELDETAFMQNKIHLRLESIGSESNKNIIIGKSDKSAVLFSNIDYKLQSGNLVISSITEMYPKSSKLKKFRSKPVDDNLIHDGNLIYKKIFFFKKQGVNKENIESSLREGADSIVAQTINDLSYPFN